MTNQPTYGIDGPPAPAILARLGTIFDQSPAAAATRRDTHRQLARARWQHAPQGARRVEEITWGWTITLGLS